MKKIKQCFHFSSQQVFKFLLAFFLSLLATSFTSIKMLSHSLSMHQIKSINIGISSFDFYVLIGLMVTAIVVLLLLIGMLPTILNFQNKLNNGLAIILAICLPLDTLGSMVVLVKHSLDATLFCLIGITYFIVFKFLIQLLQNLYYWLVNDDQLSPGKLTVIITVCSGILALFFKIIF